MLVVDEKGPLAFRHTDKPWKACLQNATPISKALLYNTLSPPSIDKVYTQHTSPPTSTRTTSNTQTTSQAQKKDFLFLNMLLSYIAQRYPPFCLKQTQQSACGAKRPPTLSRVFPTGVFLQTALCSCSLPLFFFFSAMGLSIVFGGEWGVRESKGRKKVFFFSIVFFGCSILDLICLHLFNSSFFFFA